MNTKAVSGIMLTLLLASMLTLAFKIQLAKTEPSTIIVPDDYLTIQEAINAADPGDTVYVRNGTYIETVVVNKTVSLIGQDRTTTIITTSYGDIGTPLTLSNVDATHLENFSILGSMADMVKVPAMRILKCSNICIIDCTLIAHSYHDWIYSVMIEDSRNVTIKNCFSRGGEGGEAIVFKNSLYNKVDNCTLVGYCPGPGLRLISSNHSVISRSHIISQSGYFLGWPPAIIISNSYNNVFYQNQIEVRYVDTVSIPLIALNNCSLNSFYHNNMCTGIVDVYGGYVLPPNVINSTLNSWDDGYPSGGNYWRDYDGVDLYRGPHQNETGRDAIGDSPYVIDANNQDKYPLMRPAPQHQMLPISSFVYSPLSPMVDESVTFNASASYDIEGYIVSYAWDFGDGNIVTIPDPTTTHVYTSYGVFIVNLTVIDNDGFVDSEIKSITVRQSPTASFICYPSIPEMDRNVLFDASASTPNGGTILSYIWDFGDGNVTETSSPTILHVYFDHGNFTVTLQIQDDEGLTDVETKIIHVHALPVVDFTYTPVSPLVYEIVTFNASESFDFDGYIVIYVWDLGDGTNATETDPIVHHSYSQPGIYTVALSIIDNDSLTSTTMKDLNVGKIPTSVSISTSSPSAYVGFSVNITGTLHDFYGNGLVNEIVVLYYSFSGVGTWIPITSATTDSLGNYFATWIPTATGYFMLKVEWTGNTTHFETSTTTTLNSLVYNNQYVFAVESNSTISELAFDTKNWKLSFTATGPNGTRGYVKVTVAKSLVANITNIRVFLDGRELEFTITSKDDSWLLTFTYEHSVHQVEVNLDITIIEDTTPPIISILSPENKTYTVKDVPLNFTVNETTSWIGYSLDGQANTTITGNTTLASLLDGSHSVIIFANDTAGNMGASNTVYFTVDTTPPNITDVSQIPPGNNVQPEDEVKVNATVIDVVSGVKQVTLNYTNGNGTWIVVEMTNLEGNVWDATIPAFEYCTFVSYTIVAEDEVGNIITTEEVFGYEYQYHVIPEFPPFLILPLLMIATLLAAIAYRRNHAMRAKYAYAQKFSDATFLHKTR